MKGTGQLGVWLAGGFLTLVVAATILSLPWTLERMGDDAAAPRRVEAPGRPRHQAPHSPEAIYANPYRHRPNPFSSPLSCDRSVTG